MAYHEKFQKVEKELKASRMHEQCLVKENKKLRASAAAGTEAKTTLTQYKNECRELKQKTTEQQQVIETLKKQLQQADKLKETTEASHGKAVKAMKAKTVQLQRQLETEQKQVSSEKQQKDSVEKDLKDLRRTVEETKTLTLEQQKKQDEEQLKLKAQIKELSDSKQEALKRIKERDKCLKRKEEQLLKARREKEQIEKLLAKKEEEMTPKLAEISEAKNLIDKLKEELQSCEKQAATDKNKMDELTFKVYQQREALSTSKETYENQINKLQHDTDMLKKKISKFEMENKRQFEITDDLKEQLKASEECRQKLEKRCCQNDKEICDLRELVEKGQYQVKLQERQTEAMDMEKYLTTKKFLKAQDEIQTQTSEIQELRDKITELNNIYEVEQKTLQKIGSKFKFVTSKLENTQKQLANTKKKWDQDKDCDYQKKMDLNRQLDDVRTDADKLGKMLLISTDMIQQLQNTISTKEATKAKNEQECHEHMKEIKQLRREIKTLKQQELLFEKQTTRKLWEEVDKAYSQRKEDLLKHKEQPQIRYVHKVIYKEDPKVEELEKKVEELTQELARRPADAAVKLQENQSVMRKLKETIMSLDSKVIMYEKSFDEEKQKNAELRGKMAELQEKMRKLQLKATTTSITVAALPPASSRPHPAFYKPKQHQGEKQDSFKLPPISKTARAR